MIFELTTEHPYTGKLIYSADSKKYTHKPATYKEKSEAKIGTMSTAAHTCSTVQELAQIISQGQTISGAQLRPKRGDELTDERIIQQQLVIADVDNVERLKDENGKLIKDEQGNYIEYRRKNYIKDLDEIQAICKGAGIQPCIIYESFSHGKLDPNGDPIPKYRVVFALSEPISDPQTLRKILKNLIGIFKGNADEACKDPARMFYGTAADKAVYFCNVVNSSESLLNCYHEPEPEPAQELPLLTEQAAAPRTGTKSRSRGAGKAPEADPDVLLCMIDPNAPNYGGEESAFIQITSAYKAAGGSLDVWLQWCRGYTLGKKSAQEQEKENRSTWRGLHCTGHNGAVTIASLKKAARKYAPDEYAAYMDGLNAELKSLKPKSKSKPKTTAPAQSEADSEAGSAPVQSIEEAQEQSRDPYDHDRTGKLTQANLERALELLGISARFNEILHRAEVRGRVLEEKYPADKFSAVLPMFLYDDLQHHALKSVTVDKISAYLQNIIFTRGNTCNPILERINATKWDGSDRLSELFKIMQLPEEDELSRVLIRKWLIQCYCSLHNTLDNPFSVDGVLVLVGRQGYGKTRALEKLALNRLYFGEGICYDPRNKDTLISATTKWICELGEIGSTMRKDIDLVKAFISSPVDEYRAPYARESIKYARMTAFCGSTNDTRFLIDETGNRRFWTVLLPEDKYINVQGADFMRFNALQLWAQIQRLTEQELAAGATYASAFRLTHDEEQELAERNTTHTKYSKGEVEVRDIISWSMIKEDGYELGEEYLTASQFRANHPNELLRYSSEQIGRVLRKLGYTTTKIKRDGVSIFAYKLPYKKWVKNGYISAI